MTLRLVVERDGALVAERARLARSFRERLVGLLGRDRLPPGEALILEPCSGVHTLFMRFTIDVAFLDAQGRVVALVESLRPWRMTRIHSGAVRTVELPEGTLQRAGVRLGDRLVAANPEIPGECRRSSV